MTLLDHTTERRCAWGLMLAVGLTRVPGMWPLHVPDASLAAFFLAGVYLARSGVFAGLLAAALLADAAALYAQAVPPTCVTPAYAFLVPTYGLIFAAGRSLRHSRLIGARWLASTAGHVFVALGGAFVVSNGAYFAFASLPAGTGIIEYATAVSPYLPGYMGEALCYLVPVLLFAEGRMGASRAAAAAA